MRRILLASVAAMAIALAAPLAGAQYPDPTPMPPAQETQVPDPDEATTDALAPPVTPQTEAAPAPQPDPSMAQTDPAMPPSDPSAVAQDEPSAAPIQEAQTAPDPYPQTSDTYAQTAPATGASIDLSDEAVMAGMDGVPMTAADVCAPRSVSLTDSGSRLNRDARRHLINATDHASACEMQRVVIRAPDGSGAAARATLVDLGVDESLIEVEPAEDGGLALEMQFAGVATSSEEYAAIFNPVQTAALSPDQVPAAPPEPAPEADTGQPSSYEPTQPTDDEPAPAEPTAYQPPVEEPPPAPIY